jgi:ABC-type glutathione transport system ATPase component
MSVLKADLRAPDNQPAGAGASEHLLEIRGLRTYFATDDGWVHAVDGVGLTIDRGETVGIVGESGCGKTVTAHSVVKLAAASGPPGVVSCGSSSRLRARCGSTARTSPP